MCDLDLLTLRMETYSFSTCNSDNLNFGFHDGSGKIVWLLIIIYPAEFVNHEEIVKRFVCDSLGRSKLSLQHFSIKDNEDESDGQKQRGSTDSAMPFWFDSSVETVNFDLFSCSTSALLHYFDTSLLCYFEYAQSWFWYSQRFNEIRTGFEVFSAVHYCDTALKSVPLSYFLFYCIVRLYKKIFEWNKHRRAHSL